MDKTLSYVASTYVTADDIIRDSLAYEGPRILTFARFLRQNWIPLPKILSKLLEIGKYGMGSEVEIEFALDLCQEEGLSAEFYFLQIRPMAAAEKFAEVDLGNIKPENIFLTEDGEIKLMKILIDGMQVV